MNTDRTEFAAGAALDRIVAATLEAWPEHKKFLDRSVLGLSTEMLSHARMLAGLVERLAGDDLARFIRGYRWMCEMVVGEEIHFRRSDSYRYSSFAEVNAAVYQSGDIMSLYMDGLLLSNVLWSNHIITSRFYADTFLGKRRAGGRHLEVGPGHGLLLFLAARDEQASTVYGWDISPISIAHTKACLEKLGLERPPQLEQQDILASDLAGRHQFDSIVLSEVLEHLEQPQAALRVLKSILAPGGRLFVNVPINSPAIDHIYLLRTPDAAVELVKTAGFAVEETCFAPTSGYRLDKAIKNQIAVSCAIIATAAG